MDSGSSPYDAGPVLFPTVRFAVFLVVVFLGSWLTMPHPRRWRWFMLAASYFFYGAWDWRFVPLLAGLSLVNQSLALAIAKAGPPRRRQLLAVVVAADLGTLGLFKYYGFFASSVANLATSLGFSNPLPLLRLVLPIGISFITFQALSYVIDVYRGSLPPAPWLDFAVYLAFFPHLVAGPIVRGSELLPQFRKPADPRRIDFTKSSGLIIAGLAKKIVVADLLATSIVEPVFSAPASHSAFEVLVGIYAYSVQIFCDFSAYTDIAIGVAGLLGFRFPDNFNRPYAATSIQDFWRRWHMTLSRFLRDYLYIPLGGNRGGKAATYRNVMLTMLLGGLWHGAAWKFVLWGGLHGVWLAWERWRGEATSPIWWRRVRTFHLVTFAWLFFRAPDLATVGEMLGRLTDWGPAPAVGPAVLAAIAAGIGVQYLPADLGERVRKRFSTLSPVWQGGLLALALLVVDSLGAPDVAAFIYFQF